MFCVRCAHDCGAWKKYKAILTLQHICTLSAMLFYGPTAQS